MTVASTRYAARVRLMIQSNRIDKKCLDMALSAGRPEDLPDFRKPPLAETVLSLQFEPVAELTTAHVGLLWARFRKQFPMIEEHPPLPPSSAAGVRKVPAPNTATGRSFFRGEATGTASVVSQRTRFGTDSGAV